MGTISGNGTAVTGLGGASGYGETALPRGDDAVAQVNVSAVFEQGFTLYGMHYDASAFFIATDGFVTFGSGVGAMPANPDDLTMPFLAIFMADIDTRIDGEAPDSGQIWLDVDAVNDVVTITWDDVGFYRRDATETNTFQLQMFDRGNGTMDVVYRYENIDWTSGDLQGGSGGLGGTPAFIGYRILPSGDATGVGPSGSQSGQLALPTTPGNTGVTGMFVFRLGGGPTPITGGSGNDTMGGTSYNDILQALGGDDWIFASGGSDTIDGGSGEDVIDFSAATTAILLDLANASANSGWAKGLIMTSVESFIATTLNDTLRGGTAADWFDGWSGADSLVGNDGNDTLEGGSGNDTAYGGAGSDELYGGTNDDKLGGGADADTLYGNDGADTLTGDSGADSLAGANGADSLSGGDNADTVNGGSGNDTLNGDAGNDSLVSSDGNDSVYGGDGNDTFSGGNGADRMDGGLGNDSVSYGLASAGIIIDMTNAALGTGWALGDTLVGIETVAGSTYADVISGSGLSDSLSGAAGNDSIKGRAGGDTLNGGDGNDTLVGDADNDSLLGANGKDSLAGSSENDILKGGADTDSLYGGFDLDTLYGGDGADLLQGGDGDDFLAGDAGSDSLTGGAGLDVFFSSGKTGQGADLIRDYQAAQDDILMIGIANVKASDFTVTYATLSGAGSSSVAEAYVTYDPTGEVLWIIADGANMAQIWVQSSSSDVPFALT